jgi:hypothetical protein
MPSDPVRFFEGEPIWADDCLAGSTALDAQCVLRLDRTCSGLDPADGQPRDWRLYFVLTPSDDRKAIDGTLDVSVNYAAVFQLVAKYDVRARRVD